MDFEWDEAKRQEILADRGIDVRDVALMFEAPDDVLVWRDERMDYGEVRYIALGRVDGVYYRLVYTLRGAVLQLITAWRIRDAEYEKHKARLSKTTEGNEG